MIVKIKRQDNADEKSYYSEFRYMGSGRQTVAHILDELNYTDDLYNIMISMSVKLCGTVAVCRKSVVAVQW